MAAARRLPARRSPVHLLPTPVTESWDWQMRAACRDVDNSVFFHPEHERGQNKLDRDARAKTFCGRCPVTEQCLRHALRAEERYGVWGGLTADERAAILRHPSQVDLA